MLDLELTFAWLGIPQYLERFIEAGFDTWETVIEITEEDLELLGVERGHRRKLQKEIAFSKSLSNPQECVSPTVQTSYEEKNPETDEKAWSTKDDDGGGSRGKRRYRHHPKSDQNAPKRPYSAYVMFSNKIREELNGQMPSFVAIARYVGQRWQSLAPEEKELWKSQASTLWERYKSELVAYQRTDHHKRYLQYLTDFKSTQATKKIDGKPLRLQNKSSSDSRSQPNPDSSSKKTKGHRSTASSSPFSPTDSLHQPSLPRRRGSKKEEIDTSSIQIKKESDAGDVNESLDPDKKIDTLWSKATAYEDLLLQFMPQLDASDQHAVRQTLQLQPQLRDADYDTIELSTARRTALKLNARSSVHDRSAGSVPPRKGSSRVMDHVAESAFMKAEAERRTREFVGEVSEITWTRSFREEMTHDPWILPKESFHPSASLSAGQHRGWPTQAAHDVTPNQYSMRYLGGQGSGKAITTSKLDRKSAPAMQRMSIGQMPPPAASPHHGSDHDGVEPDILQPSDFYGNLNNQSQYFGNFATSEQDLPGFQSFHGPVIPTLFPTSSNMNKMANEDDEDHDMFQNDDDDQWQQFHTQ